MGSTLAAKRIALELLALLPVRSELVIELPFLGVLQDFIGFVDFLEFFLSRLVAGIEVGMVFSGKLLVGFGYGCVIRATVNAKQFVLIFIGY